MISNIHVTAMIEDLNSRINMLIKATASDKEFKEKVINKIIHDLTVEADYCDQVCERLKEAMVLNFCLDKKVVTGHAIDDILEED